MFQSSWVVWVEKTALFPLKGDDTLINVFLLQVFVEMWLHHYSLEMYQKLQSPHAKVCCRRPMPDVILQGLVVGGRYLVSCTLPWSRRV